MVNKLRKNYRRGMGKVLSLKNLLIVCLALSLIFPPLLRRPPFVLATSATYTATADSHINQAETVENYGGNTILEVKSRNERNERLLVKFDLSSIPAGVTIESATLQLYLTTAPTASRTYDAHRITTDWTEGTGTVAAPSTSDVTWTNRTTGTAWTTAGGDFNVAATASTTSGTTANVWLSWNITADVVAWYGGTATNYGMLIKDNTESAAGAGYNAQFAARQSGSNIPNLVVTYVKASTTVSPSSVFTFQSKQFTVTITNSGGASGDEIRSASFTIPSGYTNIPTTAGGYTVTAAAGTKTWTVTGLPSGGAGPQTVTVTASSAADDVANTQSVQIVFTCITPSTAGATTWTSSVTGAAGGTSNPADQTVTVSAPALVLTISGAVNTQWNPVEPTTPSYSGTVTANVQAEVAWRLLLEKDRDLQTSVGPILTIASADFKYTSSGAPADNVTTPTEFNTTAAIIGSSSAPTAGTNVLVNYVLTTHYSQQTGSYTATHTYTLLAQ